MPQPDERAGERYDTSSNIVDKQGNILYKYDSATNSYGERTSPMGEDYAYYPDPNNPGQYIWRSGEDTGVASSDDFRSYIEKMYGDLTKGQQDWWTQQQKLYGEQTTAWERQKTEEVARLEQEFGRRKYETEQAQAGERGVTSLGLARIGGYLGESGGGMGVMQKLNESQRRELDNLENLRQSAISQAKNAYDSKQFALAQQKLTQSKEIEQEIYNRKQEMIGKLSEYEKTQQTTLEKTAKSQRDAFEFAMEYNIKQPYYTLDGETFWDTSTGEQIDKEMVGEDYQTIDPTALATDFETKTVEGQIIRYGFSKTGEVISKTILGKAPKAGGGGSGGEYGGVSLTKTERGWVDKIIAGEKTITDVPASAYTKVKRALDAMGETKEDPESPENQMTRLEEYEAAGDWEKDAAYLYKIKYGLEIGDYETEYKRIMNRLAKGKGTGKQWRSRINQRIEYIETGTKPK